MRHERSEGADKGWYAGPWDSNLAVAVGYATRGIDEPHVHQRVTEIYMVARGASRVRVERTEIELHAGDVLVVEPGEAHTFVASSAGYYHFVLQAPGLAADEAAADKTPVPRSRLGL